MQFVSPTTGWVVGADRVLATTDGGTVWSLQRSAPGADYSEVDAIDANHAWVVGRHQVIGTTNGGATWQRLAEPCPVISSVHFISPSDGYAVAGGKLLRTIDDGANWTAMHAPAHVQSMCFTSTQLGWLGAHGRIYRTSDAGQVWADVAPGPHGHGVKNRPLAEVECAGSQGGWAELIGPGVGMNQQAHIGYYLNDNGSRPIFAEQMFSHPGVKVKANSPGSYSAAFSSIDGSDAVFVDWCPACGVGTAPDGDRDQQRPDPQPGRSGAPHQRAVRRQLSRQRPKAGWSAGSTTSARMAFTSPGRSSARRWRQALDYAVRGVISRSRACSGGVLGPIGADFDDPHPAVRRQCLRQLGGGRDQGVVDVVGGGEPLEWTCRVGCRTGARRRPDRPMMPAAASEKMPPPSLLITT